MVETYRSTCKQFHPLHKATLNIQPYQCVGLPGVCTGAREKDLGEVPVYSVVTVTQRKGEGRGGSDHNTTD